MICKIESRKSEDAASEKGAERKGRWRSEEKRNILIECICLLAPLVIAISQFRLTPTRLVSLAVFALMYLLFALS
jgi:hypothetical protein